VRPAVEIAGLTKRYRRVEALREIDMVVPTHSVFGFLGPNGAGKTTTMKVLMGLIRPTSGAAYVLGRDVRDGTAVRAKIGYLPQNPSFYGKAKLRQMLAFVARRFMKGSRKAVANRVSETLDMVGLGDKADRRVRALSGGELRRLGIAQAYIGRPELLILDEPSVGLDPEGRRDVLDLIESLREDTTVLFSTHILDDVQRVADHIAVLDQGEMVAQGSIAEFLSSGEVAYRIGFADDGGHAINMLESEPWVASVRSLSPSTWSVEATDQREAERRLARCLAASAGTVTEIRPEQRSLEEIYLDIVGNGS
jgi:ABC-2 type transport system ATP-binding protein